MARPAGTPAGDDASATAAVLARLLGLAASYGRTALEGLCGWWDARGAHGGSPALPTGGRVVVRDLERFPPGGAQPTSPRARRPSWRGGTSGDSGLSVTISAETLGIDVEDLAVRAIAQRWSDEEIADWDPTLRHLVMLARGDDDDARVARAELRALVDGYEDPDAEKEPETPEERWWRGGFDGLAGITDLQRIIDDFRARQALEVVEALLAQADLLARHGGRGDEVRARLDEAFTAGLVLARATHDWDQFTEAVDQAWFWLEARRDTDAQVALARRCLDDTPDCPWSDFDTPAQRLVAQVHRIRRSEPHVAEQLAIAAAKMLRQHGDHDDAWAVEAALVFLLDKEGRTDEATALCESAWAAGCTQTDLLDRLSLRLERAKQFSRAGEVCARALAAGAGSLTETLSKRQARCAAKEAKG